MDSYQFSNSDIKSSKIKDAISFQKKFLLIGMKCEGNTWKFFFFEKMRDDVNPRTFKTIRCKSVKTPRKAQLMCIFRIYMKF